MALKLKNTNFINVKAFHFDKRIDINTKVKPYKLPFGKQDFSLVSKIIKKNRPLCISFPEMSIYKRHFDKTKGRYFLIKDEKLFDKYT